MIRKALTKKVGAFLLSLVLILSIEMFTSVDAFASTCSPTTSTAGSYNVLSFSSVGTCQWTIPDGITSIKLLIVAGGGGGGGDAAGGGGGGGVYESTSVNVTPNTIVSVLVGDGGVGGQCSTGNSSSCTTGNSPVGIANYIAPGTGNPSSFSTTSVGGGGAGGIYNSNPGGNGGSGGGGAYSGGSGGNATATGSGFHGSNGGAGNGSGGGGGGGAGTSQTGGVGTSSNGGSGGNGWVSSITGSPLYYGGGGGGGGSGSTQSSGGFGGGGNGAMSCSYAFANGSDTHQAQPGVANTGGGGGGAPVGCPGSGAKGGSGIVIVAYLININTSTTLSAVSGLYLSKKLTTTQIKATVTGTDGTVTFYQNGRYIAGCKNLPTISLIATCNWRPIIHGLVSITAVFTPTSGSYTGSTALPIYLTIGKRTTAR